MLSASILSSSLCHNLGTDETFYEKYHSQKATDFTEISDIDLSLLQTLLPKTNLRRVPTYARMGLISAAKCMQKAGLALPNSQEKALINPKNLALVIGTAFSSSQMNIDFMDSILENGPELSSPTAFSHAVNNMGAGLISLILNIQGGCQTVTQFDHSFAGAIQTALLLLASGKNDYVLVGAVDEIDKRFTFTCKDQLQTNPYALTQGAVFFLLSKEEKDKPSLSLSWKNINQIDSIIEESTKENKEKNIFLSGFYEDCKEIQNKFSMIQNNNPFYGTSPLAHALDASLSLNAHKNSSSLCICKEQNSDILALLEIQA